MPQHLRGLLNEILEKHKLGPQLEEALAGRRGFDEGARELLVDALVYEFSETGLCTDDEPNERGLQIEELIDFINASWMK